MPKQFTITLPNIRSPKRPAKQSGSYIETLRIVFEAFASPPFTMTANSQQQFPVLLPHCVPPP